MRNHLRKGSAAAALLLAAIFCLGPAGALAQVAETAAQVQGQVTDAAGAAVAGATVVIKSAATGEERRATTNEDGLYVITQLNPGTYNVSVEQTGFKRHVESAVVLNAADRRPLNVALEAGNVSEVVTVTSDQNLVQDTPTGQALISGTQVVELPLRDRNFIRLVEAGIPGITSDIDEGDNFGLTSRASISINGMRRNAVNYLVDGVSNTDVGSNITLLSTPTVDSIQEFKVLSSNYTAELGRSGGGVITVVTRGGGNEYHGSLYEFHRNDRFNANTFFNNRLGRNAVTGQPNARVPKLRYNNFGGTFSGPLPFFNFGEGGPVFNSGKNKTFFFFSEEQRRISRGTTESSATVPTAAQRNGDLSANLGLPIFRSTSTTAPFCTTPGTGACTTTPVLVTDTNGAAVQARNGMVFRPSDGRAYAGNVIPLSDIDPRSRALLNAYPLPNSGTNGFTFTPVNVSDTRQETFRIDRVINDNHRIFGRYTRDLGNTEEAFGLFGPFCTLPDFCTTATRVPGQVLAISYTGVLAPTFVNEVTFNYSSNRISSVLAGGALRANFPGAEGIREAFPGNPTGIVPSVTGNGFTNIAAAQDYLVEYTNKVIRDVATWTKGNHTFKFGGEFSFEAKVENGRNAAQGSFAFSALQTQGRSGTAAVTGTGLGFGSFLLGRANSLSEAERDIIVNLKFGRRELFVQDTWKVRPNLTLDVGVRYQYFVPPSDRDNLLSSFDHRLYDRSRVTCRTAACTDFTRATTDQLTGIYRAGVNSPYGRYVNKPDKNNFSPRVGVSYSPQFESGIGRAIFGGPNKSVIRAGYGFYYDQPLVGIFELPAFTNPPFVITASYTSTTADVVTFDNPTAGTCGNATTCPDLPVPVRALQAIAPDFTTPQTQQWSLGWQREVFSNAIIDLSYVGTKGDHLIRVRNINFQVPSEIVRVGTTNAGQVRPFVGYGNITYYETSAVSRYHGLLSSFNYRFGNGFTLTAAYTFSKNLTDSTNDRDAIDQPQNPFNLRAEYAEARTSRPHVFSASYVYEIPFFRNDSSALKRVLLGGFQISGITNIESGAPVPRVAISDTLAGQRGSYPNLLSDPREGLAGTIDPVTGLPFIFNPQAFSVPELGTFGNAPRSFARLPGRNQTNLSLVKNIYFNAEKRRYLQLRAEAFNVFNHTQFTVIPGAATTFPVNNLSENTTFARPTGTRLPRELQFGAKFYF